MHIALSATAVALIALSVSTFLALYYSPIYTDEIAVRLWLSRLIVDFPQRVNLYPLCESHIQAAPFIWLLPGAIEWLIHGQISNVISLRVAGLVIAFGFIAATIFQLTAQAGTEPSQQNSSKWQRMQLYLYACAFALCLLMIGVQPVFLVTNRQEQLILPCLALLLWQFFSVSKWNSATKHWVKLAHIVLFFIAVSLILYAHPKGLYLAPAMFLVGYRISIGQRKKWLLVLVLALLSLQIAGNYITWKRALTCHASPKLEDFLGRFNIAPGQIVSNPRHSVGELWRSLQDFYQYPKKLTFQETPDANYLPYVPDIGYPAMVNILISFNSILLLAACFIVMPISYLRDLRNKRYISLNLLFFLVLIGAFLGAILNLTKNWYDAGYFYALITLIWIFYISNRFAYLIRQPWFGIAMLYFFVSAIVSLITFNYLYKEAFFNGFAGVGIAIRPSDPHSTAQTISKVADTCNIDTVNSSGLIIDDYTYLFLRQTRLPSPVTYLQLQADMDDIKRSGIFAASDGIIVRCNYLPENFRSHAKRIDNICCVPRSAMPSLLK